MVVIQYPVPRSQEPGEEQNTNRRMGETVKRGNTRNPEHRLLAGVIARRDEFDEGDAAIPELHHYTTGVICDDRNVFSFEI